MAKKPAKKKAAKKKAAKAPARKKAARPRSDRRAERAEQRADRRKLADLKRPQVETIQRLSAAFCNNIPNAAASSGAFDFEAQRAAPPEVHPVATGKHDVPNGFYRVEGLDWALEFKGGRVVNAQRVPSDAEPGDFVSVPAITPSTPLGPQAGPPRR